MAGPPTIELPGSFASEGASGGGGSTGGSGGGGVGRTAVQQALAAANASPRTPEMRLSLAARLRLWGGELLAAWWVMLVSMPLILSNIPFALVGGIVALWVTGEYLSVPASVGFIALLGIAVLNGVVLVSHFNQLRSEGLTLAEVVVQGARRRLRPVLMTAAITAFGLIPLLFASGPGSEIQRPLAIVVIGGLITATALTLMLLPILYLRFAFPKPEAPHA